jgi:hypothetical protein
MYNLNYTPTALGVYSWREIISGVREQKRLNTTDLDHATTITWSRPNQEHTCIYKPEYLIKGFYKPIKGNGLIAPAKYKALLGQRSVISVTK